jgi:phage terminase small subunit
MPNPPKPTALKLLEGTARRDRMNPSEPVAPTLEVGARPPAWLKGVRRHRAWNQLVELLNDARVLTVLDAASLALLVDAMGDYLEASDLVGGRACAHCGEPLTSKHPCTAVLAIEAEEADVDEELEGQPQGGALRRRRRQSEEAGVQLVTLPHEPGRRYYTSRTREGSLMIRPHPAMAVRQDAWKRVTVLLREFGMTPASRTRISATESPAGDPALEFLNARPG